MKNPLKFVITLVFSFSSIITAIELIIGMKHTYEHKCSLVPTNANFSLPFFKICVSVDVEFENVTKNCRLFLL